MGRTFLSDAFDFDFDFDRVGADALVRPPERKLRIRKPRERTVSRRSDAKAGV